MGSELSQPILSDARSKRFDGGYGRDEAYLGFGVVLLGLITSKLIEELGHRNENSRVSFFD